MVPDDTKLIPERSLLQDDDSTSISHRGNKSITESASTSMFQSEDKRKAKKIKKEKKKKKHKKDKHRSKEKHTHRI